MTSDTPRTDNAEIKVQCGFKETGTGQVPIAEARKIERALNECQDAGKHYRRTITQLQADLAAANALLDEVRALWPDIRQLQDGFMNGDPNFSEWDHSVRDRCIAMSFKLERKP